MIHTKEPANKVFVFVTAYRGYESLEVNEKVLKGLIRTIKTYPGAYGNIRDENVQGCFKEAGMSEATQERTLKVECTIKQAAELALLACKTYHQDAVLVVNSQTHTASLWSIEDKGEYPMVYPCLKEVSLGGSLQQVDAPKGECYSIIDGQYWEVV
nr:SAM-dependent methyltransferase [Klebsiella phage vB_Kpn_K43PH164C1]